MRNRAVRKSSLRKLKGLLTLEMLGELPKECKLDPVFKLMIFRGDTSPLWCDQNLLSKFSELQEKLSALTTEIFYHLPAEKNKLVFELDKIYKICYSYEAKISYVRGLRDGFSLAKTFK